MASGLWLSVARPKDNADVTDRYRQTVASCDSIINCLKIKDCEFFGCDWLKSPNKDKTGQFNEGLPSDDQIVMINFLLNLGFFPTTYKTLGFCSADFLDAILITFFVRKYRGYLCSINKKLFFKVFNKMIKANKPITY